MEQEINQLSTVPVTGVPAELPKQNKSKNILLIFLGLTVLVGAMFTAYFFGKKTPPPVVPVQTVSPTMVPTVSEPVTEKTESYTEDTSIAGQKRYVSPKLGVSFLYAVKIGDETFSVKEVENKIYVYSERMGYQSGQYVEVFSKKEEQSLVDAIKEKFMTGYASDKCEVVSSTTFSQYPSSYEMANIKVVGVFEDMEKLFSSLRDCPSPYTQSNGISYFLSDKNHSDNFVFFSIGQYQIPDALNSDQGWQDTIKFLD